MKRYFFIVSLIFMLFLSIGCGQKVQKSAVVSPQGKSLTFGAILPLTSPAGIFGENVKNGMELAKEDIEKEGGSVVVLYEDSAADPKQGLDAYNKLKTQSINGVFSMFSRVTVPLLPLVTEDKLPLVMTQVSAQDVTRKSPYAVRFFSAPDDFVRPHFESVLKKEKYKTLAVLHLNDEYGVSVKNSVEKYAKENGIDIVQDESFDPNATDFRTQITKIKSKKPDAVMFVPAVAPEAISIIKQMKELHFEGDLFEASVNLSIPSNIEILGDALNNVYTLSYPIGIEKSSDFIVRYKAKYQKDPLFIASFGYDMLKMVYNAHTEGKNENLIQNITDLKVLHSLNGDISILESREINPPIFTVQIVDGKVIKK